MDLIKGYSIFMKVSQPDTDVGAVEAKVAPLPPLSASSNLQLHF